MSRPLLLCALLLVAVAGSHAPGQDGLPPGANAMCPVMTEEPAKPDLFSEYEGVKVYFCCRKCKSRFDRSPELYLAALPQFASSGEADGTGTAAVPTADAGAAGVPPAASVAPPPPLLDRVGRLLGRLHVTVVHFPIALIWAAAVMELVAALRGRRAGPTSLACLALGTVGACAAAGLGWLNASYEGGADSSRAATLDLHRWIGVAVAGMAVFTAAAGAAAVRTSGPAASTVYRLGLLFAAVLVTAAGHLGGVLVFGEEYLLGPLRELRGAAAPARPLERAPAAGLVSTERSDPAGPAATLDSKLLNAVLFSRNAEELLTARRVLRLAQVQPPPAPPTVRGPTHNEIDRFIVASWERAGLPEASSPPEVCDDATFLRRVYLDVIGAVPTIDEARRFLSDTRPDRRSRLIDELLARDADYAAHWTPFWEDALGSATTELQGGIPTRGNYREWIFQSFLANKPYDVMAAELIDPAMPGHRSAATANANGKESTVAYIRNDTHTDTLQSAANVGQVFLGTSMKCASCHSHFENPEWPQTRFLSFAAMFAPEDIEVIRCEQATGQFVGPAFPFEIPGVEAAPAEDLDSRLHRAAWLLTDPANPRFAKAIVNRLWKRYAGLGLVEPHDDFRVDREASHPELLEWLAHDFMVGGYDLKRTIRLILNSRTYQLRHDAMLADRFDVGKPDEPRYFRSPALRRLTAEQLIDSIRVAATQRLDPQSRLYLDKTSTALTRTLGKPASRNEISTSRPDDAAIVQSLELLNGGEYHSLVYSGRIVRELANDPGAGGLIDAIYLAVLSRAPTDDERSLAAEFLGSDAERSTEISPGHATEHVWIDDDLPPGAAMGGSSGADSWRWVTADNGPVLSGNRSHTHPSMEPRGQHYALGLRSAQPIGPQDTLFVEVHLDPANPPRQVMVQWNDGGTDDGGWAHRAYWGEDLIPFGQPGSASRRWMGPLPEPAGWVRLEVPAQDVGLGGVHRTVTGVSFDQSGGAVHWDRAGVVSLPEDPSLHALGDLLWCLFSGPEFQYIR